MARSQAAPASASTERGRGRVGDGAVAEELPKWSAIVKLSGAKID
jgi:hypothetical protein